MSDTMLDLLGRIAGSDAVRREPGGMARVTPATTAAVAGILGVAHDEGWRVSVEGNCTWRAEDAPADVIISLRGLDARCSVDPAGLLVDVDAGVSLERLRRQVLERAVWLAIDPPGRLDRSIGGVVVTGTAGPLRTGFGGVDRHLRALTVATGDGRVLRIDAATQPELLALHAGGFGALGVVTRCELQLMPLPQADVTWVAQAPRDTLTAAGRELIAHGHRLAAAELLSPALATESEWTLAVRILGHPDEVDSAARILPSIQGASWQAIPAGGRPALWSSSARAVTTVPVTLRLAVLPEGIDDAIDLLVARLGEGMQSAGVVAGGIRWSGVADTEALRAIRRELALREIPFIIERAPWRVRRTLGHYGAYRDRVAAELSRRRQEFDPAGVLVTALDGGQEP